MSLTNLLPQLNLQLYGLGVSALAISALALCYILPYLTDQKGLRAYPGPWLAKFSSLWFARVILAGRAQTSVKDLHEKYGMSTHNCSINHSLNSIYIGPVVRISPNQVSICAPEAVQPIYARSGNVLKSPFYDAFAPFGAARSVFSTISREDHARKRKLTSHIMSAKSLAEFSPVIFKYDRMLVSHWDEMCAMAAKGMGGTKGECTWKANGERAWFNAMPCECIIPQKLRNYVLISSFIGYNYIAFDVIGM
jgi:benzoate 4-monooxygenase